MTDEEKLQELHESKVRELLQDDSNWNQCDPMGVPAVYAVLAARDEFRKIRRARADLAHLEAVAAQWALWACFVIECITRGDFEGAKVCHDHARATHLDLMRFRLL